MRLFFSLTHVILAFIPTLGSKFSYKTVFPAIAGDNAHMGFHGYTGLHVGLGLLYMWAHTCVFTYILLLTDHMHVSLNVAMFYQF